MARIGKRGDTASGITVFSQRPENLFITDMDACNCISLRN
jgi:hypothetical protein